MVAVQKEHSFKIEEGGDDGVVPIEGEFAHIDRAMGDDFSVFEAYQNFAKTIGIEIIKE